MSKHSNTLNLAILNLRTSYAGEPSIEEIVWQRLDKFIYPYLITKRTDYIDLRIIVGKGLGSRNSIDGKNPIRYYTERYLDQIQVNWRNGDYYEGQEGVIVVRF
jgi:hypothetical protein